MRCDRVVVVVRRIRRTSSGRLRCTRSRRGIRLCKKDMGRTHSPRSAKDKTCVRGSCRSSRSQARIVPLVRLLRSSWVRSDCRRDSRRSICILARHRGSACSRRARRRSRWQPVRRDRIGSPSSRPEHEASIVPHGAVSKLRRAFASAVHLVRSPLPDAKPRSRSPRPPPHSQASLGKPDPPAVRLSYKAGDPAPLCPSLGALPTTDLSE
jgi:hypothetical protein